MSSILFAFFPAIGPTEILVVGVVAVLLFGSRLPEVARSLGRALPSFKRGMLDVQNEIDDCVKAARTTADVVNKETKF